MPGSTSCPSSIRRNVGQRDKASTACSGTEVSPQATPSAQASSTRPIQMRAWRNIGQFTTWS